MSESPDKILVVDDETIFTRLCTRLLVEEGYECDAAASAEEALTKLDGNSYDLVISDINMPGMSGLDLLGELRDRDPNLAIVMATAVDDRATAILCLKLGAFGYIMKPLDHDELVINVVNALERRRLLLQSLDYQHRLEEEVERQTADVRLREQEISIRLIAAGEYRDPETGAHIRRIGMYSEVLSRHLGWSKEDVELLRLAAPMHDVGKIGIPDQILLKPGPLTDDEFEIMKDHTRIGAELLSGSDIPLMGLAQEIAMTHHEQWTGGGYPNGLSGEDIPATGRVVAIVDVYDALVHDRVYRAAMPEEEALEIMQKGKGSHFDPDMFDAFLELLDEFRGIRENVSVAG